MLLVNAIAFIALGADSSGLKVNDTLQQGYNDMYNLRFDAAHQAFRRYERDHPNDPMGTVSDAAAYLFQEFDRLHILRSEVFTNGESLKGRAVQPDPRIRREFEADLATTGRQCQEAIKRNAGDRAALLANVLRTALHADYEALIAHRDMQALSEIKDAQKEADKLLAICPNCYDADLAIGVENYLLSQKPVPVRWLLSLTGAETDKEKGLQKLRTVAEKGVYLRPYAKVLLAIAELRDGNKQHARELLSQLASEFPGNTVFKDELKKLS